MARIAALLLLMIFAKLSLAAQPILNSWTPVERLPVGQRIVVIERDSYSRFFCHIDRVDDHTLTCISDGTVPSRILFPVTDISAVYIVEWTRSLQVRRVAGIGLLGAMGGALVGSVAGFLVGPKGAIAGAAGAVIFGIDASKKLPPTPPRPRTRLVYRSP
jgi:hypothetical protein